MVVPRRGRELIEEVRKLQRKKIRRMCNTLLLYISNVFNFSSSRVDDLSNGAF